MNSKELIKSLRITLGPGSLRSSQLEARGAWGFPVGRCPEGGYKASGFVFANRNGKPYLGTSIKHLHRDVCAPRIEGKRLTFFPADFAMHSLRPTMLTRL
jgi:hypothetical protein